jgi:hypothetical protein
VTIKNVGGGKVVLVSKKGRRLTKPTSRKKAKEREREINFFKRKGK